MFSKALKKAELAKLSSAEKEMDKHGKVFVRALIRL
jgi:hypothetical protein